MGIHGWMGIQIEFPAPHVCACVRTGCAKRDPPHPPTGPQSAPIVRQQGSGPPARPGCCPRACRSQWCPPTTLRCLRGVTGIQCSTTRVARPPARLPAWLCACPTRRPSSTALLGMHPATSFRAACGCTSTPTCALVVVPVHLAALAHIPAAVHCRLKSSTGHHKLGVPRHRGGHPHREPLALRWRRGGGGEVVRGRARGAPCMHAGWARKRPARQPESGQPGSLGWHVLWRARTRPLAP